MSTENPAAGNLLIDSMFGRLALGLIPPGAQFVHELLIEAVPAINAPISIKGPQVYPGYDGYLIFKSSPISGSALLSANGYVYATVAKTPPNGPRSGDGNNDSGKLQPVEAWHWTNNAKPPPNGPFAQKKLHFLATNRAEKWQTGNPPDVDSWLLDPRNKAARVAKRAIIGFFHKASGIAAWRDPDPDSPIENCERFKSFVLSADSTRCCSLSAGSTDVTPTPFAPAGGDKVWRVSPSTTTNHGRDDNEARISHVVMTTVQKGAASITTLRHLRSSLEHGPLNRHDHFVLRKVRKRLLKDRHFFDQPLTIT